MRSSLPFPFLRFVILLCGVSSATSVGLATPAHIDFPSLPDNPWRSFLSLSGCQKKDHCVGISNMKRYLGRFGYLPETAAFDDDFDDSLELALLAYQRNFHLNATGYLDQSTLKLMLQPRCGVPDLSNGTVDMARGRSLYAYFPGKPRWPPNRSRLKYAISTSGSSIEPDVLRTVFARAFNRWAEVTTLTFTEERYPYLADLTIGFFEGDHGDGHPFDGVLGTLAHAFSPTDGRFHLDSAELWAAAKEDVTPPELHRSKTAVDLETVATHEIGHLLGLGHSHLEDSIMYPSIRPQTRKVKLHYDDIKGIQGIYGRNGNYSGPTSATDGLNSSSDFDGAAVLSVADGRLVRSFVATTAVLLLFIL